MDLNSCESTDLRAYLVKYFSRVRVAVFGDPPYGGQWTYVRDEFIPLFLAQQLLPMIQERETFLIGNAGEGVVGVFTFEVYDKLSEFVVFAELSYRI